MRAQSSFEIGSWDEEVVDEQEGGRIVRTTLTKTFTGDVEGTSTGWMTMAYAQEDSAAYAGYERITAALQGRTGSFVLQHTAIGSPSGGEATWTVVPNSGTGQLRGLRGTGEIVRHDDGSHTFTLDYDLGEPSAG